MLVVGCVGRMGSNLLTVTFTYTKVYFANYRSSIIVGANGDSGLSAISNICNCMGSTTNTHRLAPVSIFNSGITAKRLCFRLDGTTRRSIAIAFGISRSILRTCGGGGKADCGVCPTSGLDLTGNKATAVGTNRRGSTSIRLGVGTKNAVKRACTITISTSTGGNIRISAGGRRCVCLMGPLTTVPRDVDGNSVLARYFIRMGSRGVLGVNRCAVGDGKGPFFSMIDVFTTGVGISDGANHMRIFYGSRISFLLEGTSGFVHPLRTGNVGITVAVLNGRSRTNVNGLSRTTTGSFTGRLGTCLSVCNLSNVSFSSRCAGCGGSGPDPNFRAHSHTGFTHLICRYHRMFKSGLVNICRCNSLSSPSNRMRNVGMNSVISCVACNCCRGRGPRKTFNHRRSRFRGLPGSGCTPLP